MQRRLGSLRSRGATPPPGGFRLPLANEPDFDWRLLGASRGRCTGDGEERDGVWHGGHFYTRRELDPNPRMKLGVPLAAAAPPAVPPALFNPRAPAPPAPAKPPPAPPPPPATPGAPLSTPPLVAVPHNVGPVAAAAPITSVTFGPLTNL